MRVSVNGWIRVLSAAALVMAWTPPALAQGFVLPGVGTVNRSMAGAGGAAAIDAVTSIHWNPAAIAGLHGSRFEFGTELLRISASVSSSVEAEAVAPGFPPVRLSGTTEDDGGIFPLPTVAVVHREDGSRWTYGLGFFTIGGFGFSYPGSGDNPVLSPAPPVGLGFGGVFSRFQVLQVAPTLAYQLSPEVAVGFAPTVTAMELRSTPAAFAAPDDANGDEFPTYPIAQTSKVSWGVGFQVGVFWQRGVWNVGLALKSPQWIQTFEFDAADELGRARTISTSFNYPFVVSAAVAYRGFENWTLAGDVRFIRYDSVEVFGEPAAFDSSGAVAGLGWSNILTVLLGAQYRPVGPWAVRFGYSFANNPIDDDEAAFNVPTAGTFEHSIGLGGTYDLNERFALAVGYFHSFGSTIEGPLVTPRGPLAGTSVSYGPSVDAISFALSASF